MPIGLCGNMLPGSLPLSAWLANTCRLCAPWSLGQLPLSGSRRRRRLALQLGGFTIP